MRGILTLGATVLAALTMLPTTMVVLVAIVPSLAALVADDTPKRYLFRTVLGVNLAALWPYLETLWIGGNDVRAALSIVTDLYAWAAIYGAAGLGWLMFQSLPSLVASWRSYSAERKIARLSRLQQELRDEWRLAGERAPAPEAAPLAPEADPTA